MCGGQTVTTQQHIRIDIPQGVLNGRTTAGKTTSDQTLIERIAVGDKLAMRVLFARHHVRVYRFVVRLVRDETLAEDVVGEMFLDVWRQAATFKARAAVSTWLLAIARFKALSLLRRKGEEALDEETARAIEDPADDPEVVVRKKERSELLLKCWSKLSPEHRDIIDLVYYQEKAIAEVAEIIGIPENTVKMRMFYARKRLAELLKGRLGSSLIAARTRRASPLCPVSR
jgi:RNA polymerase sigma-70 factor, ECF subfamily